MSTPTHIDLGAHLTPVIGYARVSTWREETISVEIQQNVVEEAARRSGRYISEWIIDPDSSGRNFKRRVMEAIEIVEDQSRPEKEVWSWKFSRFGRNRHGTAINLARIESVGGELISATEEVDARTAVGRFTRGMLLELAAFESDRIGEQWKETHQLRRSFGLPATGGKRFGYIWHPRRVPTSDGGWRLQEETYEVDPAPAPFILDSYREYILGTIGFGRIATRLRGAGFVNTRGDVWQDATVKWYMDSGFAAGLLRVHRQDIPCQYPGACQKRDHYDFAPAEHEAIITGEEWDAYLSRRERRRQTPRRALAPVYPLAGLLRCGLCLSAAMIHQSKKTPGYAYRCDARSRGKVQHQPVWRRRILIEQDVLDWLHKIHREIDAAAAGAVAELPAQRKPQAASAAERTQLMKKVAKYTAAVDRVTDGYALGDIPRDQYLRTHTKMIELREEAQSRLDKLEKQSDDAEPADHRETVEGLIQEWDTIDIASKRTLLSSLVRRIEFTSDGTVVVPVWEPDPAEK